MRRAKRTTPSPSGQEGAHSSAPRRCWSRILAKSGRQLVWPLLTAGSSWVGKVGRTAAGGFGGGRHLLKQHHCEGLHQAVEGWLRHTLGLAALCRKNNQANQQDLVTCSSSAGWRLVTLHVSMLLGWAPMAASLLPGLWAGHRRFPEPSALEPRRCSPALTGS